MPLTPEQKAAFLSGLDDAEAAPAQASQAVGAYKEQALASIGAPSQEPQVSPMEDRKNRFIRGMSRNLVTQAGDYLTSISPALGYDVITGETAEDAYGEGFNDASPALRRQMMHEKRQAVLDQFYPVNAAEPSSWGKPSTWDVSGAVGEMVDPSTALAFGKGVKGALLTGGALGGTQSVVEQLNSKGRVDLGEVTVSAAVTAAGAGALEKFIAQPLTAFVRSKLSRGSKVTSDEVAEIIKSNPNLQNTNTDSVNFDQIADQLNERFRLNTMTPEKARMLAALDTENGGVSASYNEAQAEYMMGKADDFSQQHELTPKKKGKMVPVNAPKYSLQPEKDLATGEALAEPYSKQFTEQGIKLEKKLNKASPKKMVKEPGQYQRDYSYVDDSGTLRDNEGLPLYLDDDRLSQLRDSLSPKPDMTKSKGYEGTDPYSPGEKRGVIRYSEEDLSQFETDTENRLIRERLNQGLPDQEPERFGLPRKDIFKADSVQKWQDKAGEEIDNAIDVIAGTNTEKAILQESSEAVGGFSKDAYSVVNYGLGDLTHRIERQKRAMGQNPGSAYAAIVKKDLPWTGTVAQKISPAIGKLSDDSPQALQAMANHYNSGLNGWLDGIERFTPFGSLEGRLKQAGVWGELGNKMNREHVENAQLVASSRLKDVDVSLSQFKIKPGSAEDKMALDISRKVIHPTDAPPHVRQYSQALDQMIAQVAKDAVDSGVWTKEEAARYAANRREKGYIPRIIDYDKLSTSSGRDLFLERVSQTQMSKDDIVGVLKAYMGENEPELREILKTLPSGQTIIMPRDLAQKIWASRSKLMTSYRSKHLEAPRVLPERWEAILTPFYINDSRAVMANYLKDAYHRIEGAKIWGPKDEKFVELYKKVFQISPRLARSLEEGYRASVADSNSHIAQSFLNKSDKWQRASASVRAWQTLKMSFSAITNVWQGPINGLTRALNMTELPVDRRLRVAISGLQAFKTIGKGELRDSFDRSGAAFSTTFTQAMGDYNEAYHSILGKLPRLLSPLEIVNNPSKFLKAVGQFLTEDFNRAVGYNQGRAYLEQLLATSKDLAAQGNRANPKKVQQVNKALQDAGIPIGADPDKISLELIHNFAKSTAHAYDQAVQKMGQRFSNETNFVNTPFKLPFPMQSFWGKILFQFASYDFHQTRFVWENALKPAVKAMTGKPGGTLLPLMAYLGVGAPGGMAVTTFYSWILGDDKDLTSTKNLLFSMTRIAGLGRITTLLQAASSNKFGLASAFMGPTVGDVSELGYGAMQTVEKKNIKPLAQAAMGVLPPFPLKKELLKQDKDNFRESMSEKGESLKDEKGFWDL